MEHLIYWLRLAVLLASGSDSLPLVFLTSCSVCGLIWLPSCQDKIIRWIELQVMHRNLLTPVYMSPLTTWHPLTSYHSFNSSEHFWFCPSATPLATWLLQHPFASFTYNMIFRQLWLPSYQARLQQMYRNLLTPCFFNQTFSLSSGPLWINGWIDKLQHLYKTHTELWVLCLLQPQAWIPLFDTKQARF